MKLEKKHIDQIIADFNKMQTKEDLLRLLNLAKTFVYHEKVVPFELKQLTWYANPKLGAKRYTEFKISKKSGADRSIHAPVETLKSLQKTLSFVFQCVFQPHEAAMGFVKERSIVDNAKLHVGSRYVYNIDLKDFFSSIDQARVWKCLQLKPFNLITNNNVSIKVDENDIEERKEDFFIPLQPGILKRREKIWMFLFRKSNYKEGSRIIVTPNGNKITYNVKKDTSKSGLITVFKDQTDIDNILAIAIKHIEKLGLEISTDAMVGILIKEVIDKDQESLISSKKQNTIANILASLCCTEMEVERKNETGEWVKVKRNVLPQGAPTSPVITNIVCQKLDYLLSGVAKRFGLKYSRYADDITFSSLHNVYQPESKFLKELHRIISEQNFHIKESKTRLQKDGYRKEVTGLLVNEKANVQKRYIKQLRMWLYYWESYGYERASGFFLQQYITDKGHVKNSKPDMVKVISGKLDYLKMVKNADNELYLNLKSRFDKLNSTNIKSKTISEAEKPTNIFSIKLDYLKMGKGEDNELFLKFRSKFDKLNTTYIKSKTISEAKIPTKIDTNQVKITLEVLQSPEMNDKLNNSINIPKDTVLPNTIIVQNSIDKFDEVIEDDKSNNLFPHNPIYTISFLKKFKIGDGSGFKELVHDVILSDETILDILNKVKSHPNFIYHFKKEFMSDVSFLNIGILMSVRELIVLFEKEGIPYYHNTKKHPFNNDSVYTKYALQFKKKYRYGSGSEYSKLQTDIVKIFNDQRVPLSSLSFMPDERKFNIRSSFFTWQPSIYNGIRYIIQGIRDHSNINGISTFNPNTKKISVEVERIQAENLSFVELRIFDCMSVSKIDSFTLLQFFQGSSPFKFDFRNLCDWIVECDFLDEPSKRLNLLYAPECGQSIPEIENLSYSVGGFKHILKFYDVK